MAQIQNTEQGAANIPRRLRSHDSVASLHFHSVSLLFHDTPEVLCWTEATAQSAVSTSHCVFAFTELNCQDVQNILKPAKSKSAHLALK